jgi:hypothetical protein
MALELPITVVMATTSVVSAARKVLLFMGWSLKRALIVGIRNRWGSAWTAMAASVGPDREAPP